MIAIAELLSYLPIVFASLAILIAVLGLAIFGYTRSSKFIERDSLEIRNNFDNAEVGVRIFYPESDPSAGVEVPSTGFDMLSADDRDQVLAAIRRAHEDRDDARRHLRDAEKKIAADNRRYALLREYATQGLVQGRLSFRVSLAAAGLGFAVIMVGVVLAILGSTVTEAVIPVISGAVIDAVALLFFAQDRRHQKTMFDFFERLREDRKLDEGLDMVSTIADDEIRARVQAALVLHFAQIPDTLEVLRVADRNSGADKPESTE